MHTPSREIIQDPAKPGGDGRIHTPLLPQAEIESNVQALLIFIPMAIKYLVRHLTVGTFIRLRRNWLKRVGGTYYL